MPGLRPPTAPRIPPAPTVAGVSGREGGAPGLDGVRVPWPPAGVAGGGAEGRGALCSSPPRREETPWEGGQREVGETLPAPRRARRTGRRAVTVMCDPGRTPPLHPTPTPPVPGSPLRGTRLCPRGHCSRRPGPSPPRRAAAMERAAGAGEWGGRGGNRGTYSGARRSLNIL